MMARILCLQSGQAGQDEQAGGGAGGNHPHAFASGFVTRFAEGGAFKTGEARVLVATDIAARGIDIANLPVVVTWDRRRSDRDATDTAPPAVERRRQMSFTWEMADFVVVPGNEATEADSQPSEAAAPESQATPATDADLPTRKSS